MTDTPNAAAIRARLNAIDENGCETCSDFVLTAAIRAVLDLAADHDLCPALADCARDPSSCNELDITNTIATALGVGTP